MCFYVLCFFVFWRRLFVYVEIGLGTGRLKKVIGHISTLWNFIQVSKKRDTQGLVVEVRRRHNPEVLGTSGPNVVVPLSRGQKSLVFTVPEDRACGAASPFSSILRDATSCGEASRKNASLTVSSWWGVLALLRGLRDGGFARTADPHLYHQPLCVSFFAYLYKIQQCGNMSDHLFKPPYSQPDFHIKNNLLQKTKKHKT